MDFSFGYLFSNLLISLAGASFFIYGKSAQRFWPLMAGVAMSIYPFFVSNEWALWGLTVAILVALFFMRER